MADPKLLEVLKCGPTEWNQTSRPESPNLEDADLRGASLEGVALSGAILRGADMSEANLTNADLSRADLGHANLNGANLEGAKFFYANLTESSFINADLARANLTGSTLTGYTLGADFSKANLEGAQLYSVGGHLARFAEADLTRAILSLSNFSSASFRKANLEGAQLFKAELGGCNLSEANMQRAFLERADLRGANLSSADLTQADLRMANLSESNLADATFCEANLSHAILVDTRVNNGRFSGARVYGCSVWSLEGLPACQEDLLITPDTEAPIRVDNLDMAQFIYLLLNNQKLRDVLDTITSKAVLILGRFGDRKRILDAIRSAFRKRGYLPILFDFHTPQGRDFTETIRTLAGLARFIVADLTDPASVPKELEAIIPSLAVPVRPLIQAGQRPFSMYSDFWKYPWVISEPFFYQNLPDLIENLDEHVVTAVEAKWREITHMRRSGREVGQCDNKEG